MSRFLSGFLVLCMTVCLGCGTGQSKPQGSKVSGKVTYKGEPVKEGTVNLYCSATSDGGAATLKEDGTFETHQPLAFGLYVVSVVPPLEEKDDKKLTSYRAPKDAPNIPQKYRSSTTSGLTYELNATSGPIEIDMK